MPLELLSIAFNHDTTSATADALNIRKNRAEAWTLPEWRRGETFLAEHSRAAYTRRDPEDRTRPFTIKARFRRTTDIPATVRIRAVDPRPPEPAPSGCGAVVVWLVRGVLTSFARSVNLLGDVAALDVTFTGDQSDELTFELPNASIDRFGVRLDDISWRWEYQVQGGAWTPFETTHHRIYCLPGMPSAPWQQTPYMVGSNVHSQIPWTDVLDHACSWAMLSADIDTAAAQVTRRIYSLGPRFIRYDCPGHGRSHYTFIDLGGLNLRCTEFLERLAGGEGCGYYVNCTDCAAFVAVFANILGASLRPRMMHHPEWTVFDPPEDRSKAFALNAIVAIGTDEWNRACGWGHFRYHEVAWLGGVADGRVYDACLQVDVDADPSTPPHIPEIPTRLPFDGPLQYRDRLAAPGPGGRDRCVPDARDSDMYVE